MKAKFFVAFFALTALVACNSNDNGQPQVGELSLSSQSLNFSADQLTPQTISVSFDGNWFIKTNNEDWLTVSRESNSAISVKVAKNTVAEPRSATFSVCSVLENGPVKEVSVSQEAYSYSDEEPLLEMDCTDIVFAPVDPEPVTVHITAKGGVKWALRIDADDNSQLFFSLEQLDENTIRFVPWGDMIPGNKFQAYISGIVYNVNPRVSVPQVHFSVRQEPRPAEEEE